MQVSETENADFQNRMQLILPIHRTEEAKKFLEELKALAKRAYVSPASFASIYFGLGKIDEGFDWMEKAIDEHDVWSMDLPMYPLSDPLRSHPRYHPLLRKMNLEP